MTAVHQWALTKQQNKQQHVIWLTLSHTCDIWTCLHQTHWRRSVKSSACTYIRVDGKLSLHEHLSILSQLWVMWSVSKSHRVYRISGMRGRPTGQLQVKALPFNLLNVSVNYGSCKLWLSLSSSLTQMRFAMPLLKTGRRMAPLSF